jgi:hypothetical protein
MGDRIHRRVGGEGGAEVAREVGGEGTGVREGEAVTFREAFVSRESPV